MPRKAAGGTGNPSTARSVLAPENLPFQLHLLAQGMTRRMQEVLAPFCFTPLHWGVLCCLWREDGLPPKELALRLSQLGGTITVALDAMERRLLVRRRAAPDDGRSVSVFLTARGRKLEHDLVPAASDLIADLFRDLSAAEYQRFATVVRKLRQRTEALETSAKAERRPWLRPVQNGHECHPQSLRR